MDLGGQSTGAPQPLQDQKLSISSSFSQNFTKSYVGTQFSLELLHANVTADSYHGYDERQGFDSWLRHRIF